MADRVRMLRASARRAATHSGIGRRLLWRARSRSEVDFWLDWLSGAPGTEEWADDRVLRLDPTAPIRDPVVRTVIDGMSAAEVALLDVGAGPLTRLGYRHPGKTLHIVAVDPLADRYDRLLDQVGIVPPIRTVAVAGENILEHFAPHSFDLAYASNALDHSADPLTIISNMVAVVRRGGVVVLRHKRNEGRSAGYAGLHQWNFDVRESAFVLWNDTRSIDVGATIAASAETVAWLDADDVVARLDVR